MAGGFEDCLVAGIVGELDISMWPLQIRQCCIHDLTDCPKRMITANSLFEIHTAEQFTRTDIAPALDALRIKLEPA